MDCLSAKGCTDAFKQMGGVDVHIIRPMPKYIHNGQLVSCETTAVFCGNMPRKGAGGYATLFTADGEALQTSHIEAEQSEASSVDSETDTRSVDSNGNVPGLIV